MMFRRARHHVETVHLFIVGAWLLAPVLIDAALGRWPRRVRGYRGRLRVRAEAGR